MTNNIGLTPKTAKVVLSIMAVLAIIYIFQAGYDFGVSLK